MRIPFSYKQHFFQTVLWGSFLTNVTLLGFGNFWVPTPHYAVEQAPASMEVIISPQPKLKAKPKPEDSKVISVANEASKKVIQKEKQKLEQENQKPIHVPAVKGALTEAKPAYLKNPAPVYPEYARGRGWEGTVILKVLVGSDGKVQSIIVKRSSGHQILDESALNTVRKWQFQPARVGNMAFSSWINIPVRFVLVEKARLPAGREK